MEVNNKNVKIDYEQIILDLAEQFLTLREAIKYNANIQNPSPEDIRLYELTKDLSLFINDEQNYSKIKEKDKNGIYIVVSFNRASVNLWSAVMGINCSILGTENKIKPAQALLAAFCTAYNLQPLNDNPKIIQYWVTPSVITNFNPTHNAYRSLFALEGTLVVSDNAVRLGSLTYQYGETIADSEEIPFIAFHEAFQNNGSPQVFGNTFGLTKTETNSSVYTFTFSTYTLDTHLVADCMAVKGFRNRTNPNGIHSTKSPNDVFKIYLEFNNGFNNIPSEVESGEEPGIEHSEFFSEFKLVSYSDDDKIGEIPTFTATFTH